MSKQQEPLRLALEAFENIKNDPFKFDLKDDINKAITTIKEALANEALEKMAENARELGLDYEPEQTEQEPVVFWDGESRFVSQKTKEWDKRTGGTLGFGCDIALYTTPPQRKPLTDEEAQQTFAKHNCTISTHLAGILARAIEAKLKEKNT
jgi:hypothetical protein